MGVRQSIAIIAPGGFGTGRNNAGIPVVEGIVARLSLHYDIVVFQLFRMNADYRPNGFEVVEILSPLSTVRMLKFLIQFQSHHRRRKFVAVHGLWALPCGLLAVVAARLWRIKSVISVLGGDAIALPAIRYGQLNTSLSKSLVFFALTRAHKVNAPSRYLVENLRRAGFTRQEIDIVPLGVDTGVFSYREKRIEETVRFLHIGNLHPVKDQATLLRAFDLIRRRIKSELTIIGEGVTKNHLTTLVSELELGDCVFIKDQMPYNQLPEIYHQTDVLLHTSLSEGQPVVVAEAMAAGVVVCGTRVGLISDLDDCCVAVNVGDYESLAIETVRLLLDEQRMNLLRQNAHDWTKGHTIQWTVERFKAAYSS